MLIDIKKVYSKFCVYINPKHVVKVEVRKDTENNKEEDRKAVITLVTGEQILTDDTFSDVCEALSD